MKVVIIPLLCLVFLVEFSIQKEDKTFVKLKQGLLSGKRFKTYVEKKPYFSYQGIPYAEPPIASLRFKPPVPHNGWNETFNAHKAGYICMQTKSLLERPYRRSENCLLLNVYTPKLKKDLADNFEKKPVIVYVHGGHFKSGSGSKWEYGPDFFIEDNAILVTVNYRLEIPGFLDLEDEVVMGNMGIKDVILALKWVKDNIEEFGGDAGSVTIYGQDAGGVIVDILLLTSSAKGLFQKAILQSGAALQPHYFLSGKSNRERAFKLLKYFEKSASDSEEYIKEFEDIDMVEAINNYIRIIGIDESRQIQRGILPFSPSIEPDLPGAVLTKLPELITPNIDIPLMIGFNSRENTFESEYYIRRPSFLTYINRDFQFTLPMRGFRFQHRSGLITEAEQDIRDFYYPEGIVRITNVHEYINMTSDEYTIYAIDKTVKRYAQHTTAPLYYYRFSHFGSLNYYTNKILEYNPPEELFGASKGDEICYLFRCVEMNEVYDKLNENKGEINDLAIAKRMVRMWVNFAKNGNPTPPNDAVLEGFEWKPVSKEEHNFIDITDKLINDKDPFEDRMKFWDEFIEKYSSQAVDGVAGELDEDLEFVEVQENPINRSAVRSSRKGDNFEDEYEGRDEL